MDYFLGQLFCQWSFTQDEGTGRNVLGSVRKQRHICSFPSSIRILPSGWNCKDVTWNGAKMKPENKVYRCETGHHEWYRGGGEVTFQKKIHVILFYDIVLVVYKITIAHYFHEKKKISLQW